MAAVTKLRRHQLAYLTAAGWREALGLPMEELAANHLQAWSQRGLPLVVTRQGAAGAVALGWPGPLASGRLRVALAVSARSVGWFDEFPHACEVLPLLPRGNRAPVLALLKALEQLGTRPRVYGSYGWQLLSGLAYVHAASDLDLWLAVASQQQADAAVQVLQAFDSRGPRVDGELMFPDGAAVAWREYAAWRCGRARGLLVKRLESVGVEQVLPLPAWCEAIAA